MENTGSGIGLGTILFVVFLVLKLCGVIDWSWWWVTAPIWIPVAFCLLIITITVICVPKVFTKKLKESIDKELKKQD
jgi:hypothetical protein